MHSEERKASYRVAALLCCSKAKANAGISLSCMQSILRHYHSSGPHKGHSVSGGLKWWHKAPTLPAAVSNFIVPSTVCSLRPHALNTYLSRQVCLSHHQSKRRGCYIMITCACRTIAHATERVSSPGIHCGRHCSAAKKKHACQVVGYASHGVYGSLF